LLPDPLNNGRHWAAANGGFGETEAHVPGAYPQENMIPFIR